MQEEFLLILCLRTVTVHECQEKAKQGEPLILKKITF